MRSIEISSGSAMVRQVLVLCFFVPFILLLSFIIFKNFTFGGVLFLLFCIALAYLIIKNVMRTADIVISDDLILSKNIFGTTKRSLTEYKSLEHASAPFTYYIEFEDGKKEYFFLSAPEILRQSFDSKSNRLDELKKLFEGEKARLTTLL